MMAMDGCSTEVNIGFESRLTEICQVKLAMKGSEGLLNKIVLTVPPF